MRAIRKIVVLGANGAMGAGAAAIFASAGIPTAMLARTIEKAEAGRSKAEQMSKGKVAPKSIAVGTYDNDLATVAADADLIFECVAEDLATKRQVFALVDKVRAPGSIVATVSSGLSIAAMCAGQSDDFRASFLGIHLFNPPTIIRGCELIPHAGTSPEVTAAV
ncbi:MAG TPA: 3-hydroxyacyl-CoA dehydrogenase NAD-binding domain-containing protein, partial [Kofleriaceae bacterium]|nr:3-hydroxyacyl-CoA dehydrogenase NAD-binding domain-containing protein [Kofleriaceae bacterium]